MLDELDEAFRSDRSIWLKLGGCGFVAVCVVITAMVRSHRRGNAGFALTTNNLAIAASVAASIGVFLGLVLSLKDVVERRLSDGRRIHPLLRLYLGSRKKSLVIWFFTIIVVVFIAAAVIDRFELT
jgi:hypothetical protein